MFIIDAERKTIFNVDYIKWIAVFDTEIRAQMGEPVKLGVYASKERAQEIFKEMLNAAFPPSIELPFAANEGDCYYMPEV